MRMDSLMRKLSNQSHREIAEHSLVNSAGNLGQARDKKKKNSDFSEKLFLKTSAFRGWRDGLRR